MLQRLVFTNDFAKLLALFQVIKGDFKGALSGAEQFRRHAGATGIYYRLQDFHALVSIAEYIIAVYVHPVKIDTGRIAAVSHYSTFDFNAFGFWIDQK